MPHRDLDHHLDLSHEEPSPQGVAVDPHNGGMTQEPIPPPPPYHSYPPPLNTYALLSLIISLVVFPPVGIWLGYQARKQIAQTGERGGELATAGIVVGWIYTSLFALIFVVWCGLAVTMMSGVLMSG